MQGGGPMNHDWQNATVPLPVAAMLGCPQKVREILGECGVQVGERTELDLGKVESRLGSDAAVALAKYWGSVRRFWARRHHGEIAGGVIVRRPLTTFTQDTGKARRDLGDQYRALCDLSEETRTRVDLLLDPHDPGDGVLEMESRQQEYPACLGGVGGLGELRRHFTVTARYAPWRDRRIRRLAGVDVAVDELWPVPDRDVCALWQRTTKKAL